MKKKKFVDWIMKTILGVVMIGTIVSCAPKESGDSDNDDVSSSVVETSEADDLMSESDEDESVELDNAENDSTDFTDEEGHKSENEEGEE